LILREFGPHHWRERHWRIAEIREVVVREHTMAGIPLRLAEGPMADFLILSRRQARGIAAKLNPALGLGASPPVG
jgi:hypothetical protein